MSATLLLAAYESLIKDAGTTKTYSDNLKYSFLSTAQRAVLKYAPAEKLDEAVAIKAYTSITAGLSDAPTDYFRPVIGEYTTADTPAVTIPIRYQSNFERGRNRSSFMGGSIYDPIFYAYRDTSVSPSKMKIKWVLATYPATFNANLYYIIVPPDISASQNEIISGFDDAILLWAKYMIHLAEGQATLAETTRQGFFNLLGVNNGNNQ